MFLFIRNIRFFKSIVIVLSILVCQPIYSNGMGEESKIFIFPTFELQLIKKQSVGIGVQYYNGSVVRNSVLSMFNEFNVRRNNGDYIYGNRIAFSGTFYMLAYGGISINNYTDFQGYCLSVSPEIGVGFNPFVLLYYSYNFECVRNNLNPVNVHNLTFRFYWKLVKTIGHK